MSDGEDIPPHVRSEGKRKKSRRSRRQQGVHGQTPETGTNVERTSPPSGVHPAVMATLLPILATWGAMYEASNQPSTSFAHTAVRSPKHKRKRKASSRVPSPYLPPTKSRSPSQYPHTATPPPPYSATAIEEILDTADMEDQMNDPNVPSTSRYEYLEDPIVTDTSVSVPTVVVISSTSNSPLSQPAHAPCTSPSSVHSSSILDSAQRTLRTVSVPSPQVTHKQTTAKTTASSPAFKEQPTWLSSRTDNVTRMITSLSRIEARRNVTLATNELELREIIAKVERQRSLARERSAAEGENTPLKANPYAHQFFPTLSVTEHTVSYILPYTVEELTAHQLRVVHEYIVRSNSIRAQIPSLVDNPPEVETIPVVEREQAGRIVHYVCQLNAISNTAIVTFQQVGTLLTSEPAHRIRYTVLMAWIHELQSVITAITIQRELLQELLLPRFLRPASDQDYMRVTLEVFNITEEVLREALMNSAAISAHATRMIRTVESFQLVHMLYHQHSNTIPLDDDYQRLLIPPQVGPLPATPETYTQTLHWWRSDYDEILRTNVTSEYLQVAEREGVLLPETAVASSRSSTVTSPASVASRSAQAETSPIVVSAASQILQALSAASKVQTSSDPSLTDVQNPTVSHQFQKDFRVTPRTGKKEHTPKSSSAKFTEPSLKSIPSRESSPVSRTLRAKPSMPPYPSWREAGLASNFSHIGEGARQSESQAKPRETSDSIRVSSQDPPSVKFTSAHFEPHASSYRGPVRKPSCVFCSGRTHRSAKCHNYRSLAGRAYAAEFNHFCCNCLCDHFGDCIWTDGCTYCRLPGHHPAFCVKNPYVDLDIGMPALQFHQELARRTYQAPPPGRICKTLSDVVRRRGSKRPSRSTSPSTSKGRPRY